MTEAEYAALKVGDVIYRPSDIGSANCIGRTVIGHGNVTERCRRVYDYVVVKHPHYEGALQVYEHEALRDYYTTPGAARDARIIQLARSADELESDAAAYRKRAKALSGATLVVSHGSLTDNTLLEPPKRATKTKKKEGS
jgi:hypothetical protein